MVRITGTVATQAWAGLEPRSGRYVVSFVIEQPHALPVHVSWPFGEGPAASIAAHSAARDLCKGAEVVAQGDAIHIAPGHKALRLAGAISVPTRPHQAHYTEAAAEAA